jgi:GMP reductase
MPRIEDDVKLDFKDVLIRPKRSTLKSRSQVSLERTITFKNSKYTWTGVPIMAANMYGIFLRIEYGSLLFFESV